MRACRMRFPLARQAKSSLGIVSAGHDNVNDCITTVRHLSIEQRFAREGSKALSGATEFSLLSYRRVGVKLKTRI